uniref:tRNA (cytosine(38)-C(5))-methyltransferase n=1 Tax=Nilaparvata lugens TaxID=108931 RepID=A0A2H4V129_NILLU|nr:DNA methyltransferase 2 [Nilaparvata lugens]
MHFAMKESGVPFSYIVAAEISTSANPVYKLNFPRACLLCRNIESFGVDEIDRISPDILLMSPPCQPYTRNGLKKDTKDKRSCALINLLELLPKLNGSLKYILVENVRGFETSNARQKLLDFLVDNHFNYQEFLLSPTQFGISNSRTRYYLIAKKKPLEFGFPITSSIITDLAKAGFPMDIGDSCFPISSILEVEDNFDSPSYKELLIPIERLAKQINVMDIVSKDDARSCCFTKSYSIYMEGTGSVYSPFPLNSSELDRIPKRENYSSEEQFFKALESLKLRVFSPKEISRLMCFPEEFRFPETHTLKQKYKLLGNSINVKVVAYLIRLMINEN